MNFQFPSLTLAPTFVVEQKQPNHPPNIFFPPLILPNDPNESQIITNEFPHWNYISQENEFNTYLTDWLGEQLIEEEMTPPQKTTIVRGSLKQPKKTLQLFTRKQPPSGEREFHCCDKRTGILSAYILTNLKFLSICETCFENFSFRQLIPPEGQKYELIINRQVTRNLCRFIKGIAIRDEIRQPELIHFVAKDYHISRVSEFFSKAKNIYNYISERNVESMLTEILSTNEVF